MTNLIDIPLSGLKAVERLTRHLKGHGIEHRLVVRVFVVNDEDAPKADTLLKELISSPLNRLPGSTISPDTEEQPHGHG